MKLETVIYRKNVNLFITNLSLIGILILTSNCSGKFNTTTAKELSLTEASLSYDDNTETSNSANPGASNDSTINPSNGATLSQKFTPIRILSGQTVSVTDANSLLWSADSNFEGGLKAVFTNSILATNSQKIYQGERYGAFAYSFSVPNGSYKVNLRFVETYVSGIGQRKFNVRLNGNVVLTNFDIFAASGGMWIAIDKVFVANVSDGKIKIEFLSTGIEEPKVNAIEIVDAKENLSSTAVAYTPPIPAVNPVPVPPIPTVPSVPPAVSNPAFNAVVRPFNENSPWNSKIPSNAKFVNDKRTTQIRSPANTMAVNANQWTIPVYYASANDPIRTVSVNPGQFGWGNSKPGTVTFKCPAGALPDAMLDSHMAVYDPDGVTVHEFWYLKNEGGVWKSASYARVYLPGSGVGVSDSNNVFVSPTGPATLAYGWGGGRAYGGSIIGGLILKGETATGINHALAIAVPNEWIGNTLVYPATANPVDHAGNIPYGTRFAIPPNVDLNTLGLDSAHMVLAKALQNYGGYIVDQAGGFNLYSELNNAKDDGNKLNSDYGQMRRIQNVLMAVD